MMYDNFSQYDFVSGIIYRAIRQVLGSSPNATQQLVDIIVKYDIHVAYAILKIVSQQIGYVHDYRQLPPSVRYAYQVYALDHASIETQQDHDWIIGKINQALTYYHRDTRGGMIGISSSPSPF